MNDVSKISTEMHRCFSRCQYTILLIFPWQRKKAPDFSNSTIYCTLAPSPAFLISVSSEAVAVKFLPPILQKLCEKHFGTCLGTCCKKSLVKVPKKTWKFFRSPQHPKFNLAGFNFVFLVPSCLFSFWRYRVSRHSILPSSQTFARDTRMY